MNSPRSSDLVVAFDGDRLIASGPLAEVATIVSAALGAGAPHRILAFDAVSSEGVELDPRAAPFATICRSPGEESAAAPTEASRGPGRPRLGVVAREVTLLPRHWEWLATQPGGASATLRRLVEQARGASAVRDRKRRAQESAYRFMSAMVGNQPHFEEATRALFAGDRERFTTFSERWPGDVRDHARRLADAAFRDE